MSYNNLHTPYNLVGLGRTNNYVDQLFVGLTLHTSHTMDLQGVIPNSQLVILPYSRTETGWEVELYINPSEYVSYVAFSVLMGMGVLGSVVVMLHLIEKREDEVERRRRLHVLNFDAL